MISITTSFLVALSEQLRVEIKENELAFKLVVSEDFRYTLIMLNAVSENGDHELMLAVQEVTTIDDFFTNKQKDLIMSSS